ncbi:hypothetical protein [Kitasatospora camelliae]|uniref:Uncharacterized protein n=1 Tax=Kitasatospora camelliae TaxID=3156397 RepID=A0AAU8JXR4_9ACTN
MTDIESTTPAPAEPGTPTAPAEPGTPPAPVEAGAPAVPVDPADLPAPEASADLGTPPGRPAGRPGSRTLLRGAAAVLVAALVGVGIGEAVLAIHYDENRPAVAAVAKPAPSTPAAPEWGAQSNGNHFGRLRDLLLPVPTGYTLGPDAGALGNDSELGREQLDKRMEKNLDGVPNQYRDRVKGAWEALHQKGSGIRTYRSGGADLLVEMYLDQFNQQAVTQTTELYGAMVDDTGVFRHGPAVPGHDAARCVLPPLRAGDELDFMHCFSAEGDLLVTMNVSGTAPLNQDKVVDLFRQQLDRLARPGASV